MRAACLSSLLLLSVGCSAGTPADTAAGPAAPPESVAAPATAAGAASEASVSGDPVEGARVARRVGCERELYDDAGLVALLREGKTHDGHRPLGMPIFMFQHLSDREVRDIVAWLRSLPAIDNPDAGVSWYGEEIQQQLRDGTYPYDDDRPRPGIVAPAAPPEDPLALGKHIAYTSCTECHGENLEGWGDDDPAPSLVAVAKAYTPATFARLMREGTAANGQDTATMMSGVARRRFSPMTDEEIAALKLYLDSR